MKSVSAMVGRINWNEIPDTFQPRDLDGKFMFKVPVPLIKEFEAEGSVGKTYKVMRIKQVVWTCTCPDYRFRQRECKHIRRINI